MENPPSQLPSKTTTLYFYLGLSSISQEVFEVFSMFEHSRISSPDNLLKLFVSQYVLFFLSLFITQIKKYPAKSSLFQYLLIPSFENMLLGTSSCFASICSFLLNPSSLMKELRIHYSSQRFLKSPLPGLSIYLQNSTFCGP